MKLIRVELDDGREGWSVVEYDKDGEPQRVTLLSKPPEPTRPPVQRIAEPIRFTSAQFDRSLQRARKHLAATRRPGSTDARARQAAGQVFRAQRWFNLLRHRPAAGRVKARARAAPRRSSGTAAARSRDRPRKPDDDLDALPPRCPRCGRVALPVPGSALWSSDHCAEAIWEQIVEHAVEQALAEAEQIAKDAA